PCREYIQSHLCHPLQAAKRGGRQLNMSKRITLFLIVIVLSVLATGCGLLGFDTQVGSEAEIQATIDAIASAGEAKDEKALKDYLAATIVTEVLSGEALQGATEESKDELIQRIRSIWDDMSVNRISVDPGDIDVRGNSAT